MAGNVTFLGDVADWFDAATNRVIALRDRTLEWVDPSGAVTGRTSPYLRGMGGNPIAYVVAGQNLSLHLLQGMVDTLRFGNGIRDGGLGYAQDALRGVSVAIPALRAVRNVRNTLLLRRSGVVVGAGAPTGPIAIHPAGSPLAIQPANTVSCTHVSAFNALTRTGYRLFASVQELAANSGLGDIIVRMGRGLYPEELARLFQYLRRAGVTVTEFAVTRSSSLWVQFERLALANRRGVFMVTIDFARTSANSTRRVAHTLEAIYQPASGVRFLDTTGRIFNGIGELRQFYPQAELNADFAIGFIHDSSLVTAAGSSGVATRAVAGFATYVRLIPIFATGTLGAAAAEAAASRSPVPAP